MKLKIIDKLQDMYNGNSNNIKKIINVVLSLIIILHAYIVALLAMREPYVAFPIVFILCIYMYVNMYFLSSTQKLKNKISKFELEEKKWVEDLLKAQEIDLIFYNRENPLKAITNYYAEKKN